VIEGYSTIFSELDTQLATAPTWSWSRWGRALTAAAVEHYTATATVVAVEPLSAACGLRSAEAGHPVFVPGPHDSIMAGLNCGNGLTHRVGRVSRVSTCSWPSATPRRSRRCATWPQSRWWPVNGAAALAGLRALPVIAGRGARPPRAAALHRGATDPDAYRRIVGADPPSIAS